VESIVGLLMPLGPYVVALKTKQNKNTHTHTKNNNKKLKTQEK